MRHDPAIVRQQSLATAASLGLAVSPTLPLLEACRVERTSDEIVDRALCIHALAACAYGFSNDRALAWLERQDLLPHLTSPEYRFVESLDGPRARYQQSVEALWAMSWSLGIVPKMEMLIGCSPSFVTTLPNLKADESSLGYRSRAKLRDESEIICQGDLAYCVHWALRSAATMQPLASPRVPMYVVEQRRTALDWILSSGEWEELSLDT